MIRFPMISATLCTIALVGLGVIHATTPDKRAQIAPFQAAAPGITVLPLGPVARDRLGNGRVLRN